MGSRKINDLGASTFLFSVICDRAEKCAFVQDELRFDAAVNHRAPDFPAQLAAACPNGIDVYFENVGGAIWQAVLPLLNQGARVPGLWPDRAV